MMYGQPLATINLLAFQFGLTVHVERTRRVALFVGVGRGLVAVEDVIGGVVDQQAAVRAAIPQPFAPERGR